MTVPARVRRAACFAAAAAILGACGNDHPAPQGAGSPAPSTSPSSAPPISSTTSSPSSRPPSRGPKPTRHEVASAVATVRGYLHAWATQGPSRASRYLVSDQRVTTDQGAPRIRSGRVTSYRLYRWKGANEFTLLVSMNLRFTNNPLAWSSGSNDRFVTCYRAKGAVRYQLEFATGP